MDRIVRKLAAHPVVGLDTSIFIYHFEAHPRYQPLSAAILDGVERGKWRAVTSAITLMELTVQPWRLGREDVARKYEALLAHFPHLQVVDIDRSTARLAAQLRAKYSLRPPDALQAAACLAHGASAWGTNDRRLVALQPIVDVVVLDDYLP
jgi:predicted nucleic acid-binding protein